MSKPHIGAQTVKQHVSAHADFLLMPVATLYPARSKSKETGTGLNIFNIIL